MGFCDGSVKMKDEDGSTWVYTPPGAFFDLANAVGTVGVTVSSGGISTGLSLDSNGEAKAKANFGIDVFGNGTDVGVSKNLTTGQVTLENNVSVGLIASFSTDLNNKNQNVQFNFPIGLKEIGQLSLNPGIECVYKNSNHLTVAAHGLG